MAIPAYTPPAKVDGHESGASARMPELQSSSSVRQLHETDADERREEGVPESAAIA